MGQALTFPEKNRIIKKNDGKEVGRWNANSFRMRASGPMRSSVTAMRIPSW
jgi:hypothetical protein